MVVVLTDCRGGNKCPHPNRAPVPTKEAPRRLGPSARLHALSLLTLPKVGVGAVLIKLSRVDSHEARELYARVMNSWGSRIDRERVTIKLTAAEAALVDSLNLPPTLVECPRWEAVYRDPNSTVEVTIRCQDKPTKRRTFRMRGGNRKMVLAELTDLTQNNNGNTPTPKEATSMATTKTRSRKKAPEVDELEDLEELEGLEDLDDLEEEDEVEEEAPKPKRSRRKKAAAVEEPEDEEEDEEDEEPTPKRRSRSKKTAASKPAAKKGAKRTAPTPPTRELPTGKLGPSDIAALAGVEARDVRGYLRKNGIEKDEALGRYSFTKKQAETHAKAIKKAAAA